MAGESVDTFRLHLLRHANAAWPDAGRRDFDRELDARGRAEALDVARKAMSAGIRPENIISSPAIRCRQTTLIFLEFASGLFATYDDALYSGGVDAYMDQIRHRGDASGLMLVGHNPMIEGLATMLTEAGRFSQQLGWGYPTAGLLTLEFDLPLPLSLFHRGRPVQFITPDLT